MLFPNSDMIDLQNSLLVMWVEFLSESYGEVVSTTSCLIVLLYENTNTMVIRHAATFVMQAMPASSKEDKHSSLDLPDKLPLVLD